MITKEGLGEWLVEALKASGGSASIINVCKYVWDKYENDLKDSGELFFTWQYDIRWAASRLREKGVMRAAEFSPQGIWELV